jgi:hypothetical protein
VGAYLELDEIIVFYSSRVVRNEILFLWFRRRTLRSYLPHSTQVQKAIEMK